MHPFVSSFLLKHLKNTSERFSREEMIEAMHRYIKYFSYLEIDDDESSFAVRNKLKIFFNECKFIAKKRGKDITVPEVMKYTDICKYIDYFIVSNTDADADLMYRKEYQKRFSETIFDELQSVVYSPERISYWIHFENVDLSPFSDSSKFI